MEAFGDIGFNNQLTFWWSNRNSGGNVSHQGLEVQRNADGVIRQLTFATVAQNAHKCYRVVWSLESEFKFDTRYYEYNRASVYKDGYGKLAALKEFDDIVLDLMVAMLPDWMLYTHRPRNPANGCFAG